jgi:tellurite resistance protein TehA-like permease
MKSYILSGIATVLFVVVLIAWICGYEISNTSSFFSVMGAIVGNFTATCLLYRKENP